MAFSHTMRRGMTSKRAQGKCTGHECRESAHDGHDGWPVDCVFLVRYRKKGGIDTHDPAIISEQFAAQPRFQAFAHAQIIIISSGHRSVYVSSR